MKRSDDDNRVLAAVEESLCRDADIEFAVLFGSKVTHDRRPSSDLDVAIKFVDRLSSHERFRKLCFLAGELQQEDAPFVDVSDIETLPIDVAHDAVTGKLLCGDEQAFRQVKSDIETTFDARRDDIRRHQQAVIERIAEDGLRG